MSVYEIPKGFKDMDLPLKAERSRQWCEDR